MGNDCVLFFYAGSFCKSCVEARDAVARIEDLVGQVKYIDVDKDFLVAEEWGVIRIPCVVYSVNGVEQSRFVGRDCGKIEGYISGLR
ncbi:MAG: thioredoxin family protein [Candidatus Paceibacterota bacterium]